MISAIRRAVEYCHTHDTLTPTTKEKEFKTKNKTEQAKDVHESDTTDVARLESRLKEAVVATYGSARAAFDAHSKHQVVGNKGLKKIIKRAMPTLKQEPSKLLRKQLPKRMTWIDFNAYFGGSGKSGSNKARGKLTSTKDEGEATSSGMAALPPEVPEVQSVLSVCVTC